jgi:predicted nucleotide-binding protein
MPSKSSVTTQSGPSKKRGYLSQADVPSMSLDHALKVPRAIMENYAGSPTAPLKVAKALDIEPKGSKLKMHCGASLAYGLIDGGAQASLISLTDLAKRILKPLKEGDDEIAKREAFLKPKVVGDFLKKYNEAQVPRDDIARNMLEEFGVPKERTEETLKLIMFGAEQAGFIQEIKGKKYVDLNGAGASAVAPKENGVVITPESITATEEQKTHVSGEVVLPAVLPPTAGSNDQRRKKVFLAHGKSKALVEPLKKLLRLGELEAVVSVETQSVAKPVPDKVINEMRSCGAAIIHVDAEQRLSAPDGQEHLVPNANVLIEIGAAMAIYGRRFVLLVKDGLALPSNLQGLYEVRYKGETLDGDEAIRLLEAINDIKNHPLP